MEVKKYFKTGNGEEEEEEIYQAVKRECLKQGRKEKQKDLENALRSLEREIQNKKKIHTEKQKQKMDLLHFTQKYECKKEQIKNISLADARHFEQVWLVNEAEVKELAQRALDIDSRISQEVFGVTTKRCDLDLLELSGPIGPWKPALEVQTGKSKQGTMNGSAESDIWSPDVTASKDGEAVSINSIPKQTQGNQSKVKHNKIREPPWNELDFLLDPELLNLVTPLMKEEQAVIKLGSLLYILGMDETDLPELADFLLKYEQQQREKTEGAVAATENAREASVTNSTSDLIHPSHILPALKSFVEQQNPMKNLRQLSKLWLAHARDSSKDAAYWESLGNVIPKEKVKAWDAAEKMLKQYHAVLKDISDLDLEHKHLMHQNTNLRRKLNEHLQTG